MYLQSNSCLLPNNHMTHCLIRCHWLAHLACYHDFPFRWTEMEINWWGDSISNRNTGQSADPTETRRSSWSRQLAHIHFFTCWLGVSASCSLLGFPSSQTPASLWCTPACTPQRRRGPGSWWTTEGAAVSTAGVGGGGASVWWRTCSKSGWSSGERALRWILTGPWGTPSTRSSAPDTWAPWGSQTLCSSCWRLDRGGGGWMAGETEDKQALASAALSEWRCVTLHHLILVLCYYDVSTMHYFRCKHEWREQYNTRV